MSMWFDWNILYLLYRFFLYQCFKYQLGSKFILIKLSQLIINLQSKQNRLWRDIPGEFYKIFVMLEETPQNSVRNLVRIFVLSVRSQISIWKNWILFTQIWFHFIGRNSTSNRCDMSEPSVYTWLHLQNANPIAIGSRFRCLLAVHSSICLHPLGARMEVNQYIAKNENHLDKVATKYKKM